MNRKLINGLLFGALAGMSEVGSAAITSETVINFNPGMNFSSYAGFANNAPAADGKCLGANSAGCFYEDGMVAGIVQDTSNPTAHLHRVGSTANRLLGYHSDSSGIYIRAQDSSAFSLTSLDFHAPIGDENPDNGSDDYWEILGYSSALNTDLDTAANSGNWIVKKTIANGFEGTVLFNDNALWQNISAFWIHYNGYPQTPIDGKQYGMELDNVVVNAPVPVPAAIWMFGAGLLGLASVVRRKVA